MFSSIDRCGKSAYDWNTMDTRRLSGVRRVTSRPSMRILPSVTSSSPAMSRSTVDFPQPEGPSSTTNFPDSARKLTASTAFTRPKRFVTFSRTISDKFLPQGIPAHPLRTYYAPAFGDARAARARRANLAESGRGRGLRA